MLSGSNILEKLENFVGGVACRPIHLLIIERHHPGSNGEFQRFTLTDSDVNSLEANEIMEWDNGRGAEVAQVKLGNFG
jgi:hypothetical protein